MKLGLDESRAELYYQDHEKMEGSLARLFYFDTSVGVADAVIQAFDWQ